MIKFKKLACSLSLVLFVFVATFVHADTREFITNDKRFPTAMDSGDAGKVLTVNTAGDAYELAAASGTPLTGSIVMWPLDTPPSGYLMCDGAAIPGAYTALIALIGANTPDINFAKNSKGTNTNTQEAESVGTHGHGADAVSDHGHAITVNSVGNHTHPSSALSSAHTGKLVDSGSFYGFADPGNVTGGGGAHNHGASAASNGGHTPVVQDHTGTNQPACTLINFIIKT